MYVQAVVLVAGVHAQVLNESFQVPAIENRDRIDHFFFRVVCRYRIGFDSDIDIGIQLAPTYQRPLSELVPVPYSSPTVENRTMHTNFEVHYCVPFSLIPGSPKEGFVLKSATATTTTRT